MIRAAFGKNCLTVEGHAGYAPKGQDIVCAAVSALVYALIGTLEETENVAEMVLRPGYAAVEAKKKTAAFDLVRCGLTQLADRYPDFVQVKQVSHNNIM